MRVLRKSNPDILKENEGLLTVDWANLYYTELDLLNAEVIQR